MITANHEAMKTMKMISSYGSTALIYDGLHGRFRRLKRRIENFDKRLNELLEVCELVGIYTEEATHEQIADDVEVVLQRARA